MLSAFVGSKIPETISHGVSGKCSWSPYHSLAVCHQRIDISDQTQIKDTYFYQKTTECVASLGNVLTIEFGNTSNSFATAK